MLAAAIERPARGVKDLLCHSEKREHFYPHFTRAPVTPTQRFMGAKDVSALVPDNRAKH